MTQWFGKSGFRQGWRYHLELHPWGGRVASLEEAHQGRAGLSFWCQDRATSSSTGVPPTTHISLERGLGRGSSGRSSCSICYRIEKSILTLSMEGETETAWSRICLEKGLVYSGAAPAMRDTQQFFQCLEQRT